jgi:plasmid stability protein
MAQLLIRNLEPKVIKRLKQQAKRHHRSLQSELKCIVEAATKMSIDEARNISHAWHKRLSSHSFSDSTKEVREDRNR